jgi:hypothetical protein
MDYWEGRRQPGSTVLSHILLDDDDPGLLMAYFDGRFNVAEGNYY